MKALRIDTNGKTERIELPADMHARNDAIKAATDSQRELWRVVVLKRERLMVFFGTHDEPNRVASKLMAKSLATTGSTGVTGPVVVTGQDSEGWECDLGDRTAQRIEAMSPVQAL